MMNRFWNIITGRKRVLVNENERVIALYEGEILGIFGAGEHLLPNRRGTLDLHYYDLSEPVVASDYKTILFEKLPLVAEKYWTTFSTNAQEILIIERDDSIFKILGPNKKIVVWKEAGPWKQTHFDLTKGTEIETQWKHRLIRTQILNQVILLNVPKNQIGLLYVDGELTRQLKSGRHGFWNIGQTVDLKLIHLQRKTLDVSGQEMLTKDRVTIRVNISADYKLTDIVKAVSQVHDYEDSIYRALQYAFRREIGAMTLDQILETKASLNSETGDKVRQDLSNIGIEISNIELKDVILPGEMRDILNQVVAAEKQAQANVIRRREETNATRSLLNTAKVMAENPVMLRLKELEALEHVADKVKTLTVHNGTAGLMNDLVNLRSD